MVTSGTTYTSSFNFCFVKGFAGRCSVPFPIGFFSILGNRNYGPLIASGRSDLASIIKGCHDLQNHFLLSSIVHLALPLAFVVCL